jgi:hypothetical protein
MGERSVEFGFGLVGGLLGFFGAVFALILGGIMGLLQIAGASDVSNLAYVAIFFAGMGIVGSALVRDKPKLGGILMVISALGGVVFIGFYYILAFILLLTAGLMGFIKKSSAEKNNKEIKKVKWLLCLIMSIVFGSLGVDRYLMGKVRTGVLKLITAGGLGIWWIIDIILIATKHKYKGVKWVE